MSYVNYMSIFMNHLKNFDFFFNSENIKTNYILEYFI